MPSLSIPAKTYHQNTASSLLVAQLPRFFLEAIAFGGILLIIIYIISKSGSFNSAIPIISLYVLAGYRMLPALQQIYSSFSQLAYIGPSLNKLHNDLKNLKTLSTIQDKGVLSLNKTITLKNINYS